jgi:hypothetical protein
MQAIDGVRAMARIYMAARGLTRSIIFGMTTPTSGSRHLFGITSFTQRDGPTDFRVEHSHLTIARQTEASEVIDYRDCVGHLLLLDFVNKCVITKV